MPSAPERVLLALALALPLSACKDDGDGGDDAGAGSSGDASTGDATMGPPTTTTGGPAESGMPADTEAEYDNLDDRPCPEDSFLTFENFGAMFFLNYCTGCHASGLPADQRQGAPVEVNFDDIGDIRQWDGVIWGRAADQNTTMPPLGVPPADEREMLGEWLACGAPTDADLGM